MKRDKKKCHLLCLFSPLLFTIFQLFPILSLYLCRSLPFSLPLSPFLSFLSVSPLLIPFPRPLFFSPFHSTFLLRSLTFSLYSSISPIKCLICNFLPFSFLSPFSVSPFRIPFYRLLFFPPFLAFTLSFSFYRTLSPPPLFSLSINLSVSSIKCH